MAAIWPSVLVVVLLLAGCGARDREAQARVVVEGYFQAVKAKDLDRAVTFFAPGYLETRSIEGLKEDLRIIAARLGDLQSYRLTAARWRTDLIPPESGTHVTLEYEVRYARHPGREIFTVHKPFGRGEYKISGYHIVSEGFLRE